MIGRFGFTVLIGAATAGAVARAASPAQCVTAYSNHARAMASFARTLNFTAHGTVLGFSIAGTSTSVGRTVSTVGTLGGSTLGTYADAQAIRSQFASNVAQAVFEAQGRVIGPFTATLASDLNDAIYGSGRFGRLSNPFVASQRATLAMSLNGRRITADEVGAATARLIDDGSLCDDRGDPLDQFAWAKLVVDSTARGRRG